MKKAVKAILLILVAVLVVGGVLLYFNFNKIINTFYPRKYSQYVTDYSNEYETDEDLVYAIIRTESGFNPNAVSNVGARGLMQLTKETFDWVKSKVSDKTSTFDDMFTPELNIKYGTYLISYLLKEFGNVEAAAAAYHAGRGAVGNWLNNENYSSDGKTLDKIPISDTDHYVDKIAKCYSIYKKYK